MHALSLLSLAQQMPGMSPESVAFSLFNHRLAGLLVVLLGVLGVVDASASGKREWLKLLWPMPLIVLGIYLLLRSDAPAWPPHIVEQMSNAEGVQHKIFAVLVLSLGGIDLLRRSGRLMHPIWNYLFYAVMLVAGIFLLFHGGHHSALVRNEHAAMAVVAIAIVVAKVMADRKHTARWLAVGVVPSLFILLGVQLLLYTE